MKRTRCFDFSFVSGSCKKRVAFHTVLKLFFGPVTSNLSRHFKSVGTAGIGFPLASSLDAGTPLSVPVPFYDHVCKAGSLVNGIAIPVSFLSMPGCLYLCDQSFLLYRIRSPYSLAGRTFSLSHFIKEYIVTISNHIRRIEELSEAVIAHVDSREYREAHSALDDIEARARAAHAHIDHLQSLSSDFLLTRAEDFS